MPEDLSVLDDIIIQAPWVFRFPHPNPSGAGVREIRIEVDLCNLSDSQFDDFIEGFRYTANRMRNPANYRRT